MCWKEWKDFKVGDDLMCCYMLFVIYYVGRIFVGLLKLVYKDDFMSFGMFGLYDVFEKFDFSWDLKFDIYVLFRICGVIIDGFCKEDWFFRILCEKIKKVEVVIEKFEQCYFWNVLFVEIVEEFGMMVQDVVLIMNEGFFVNLLLIDEKFYD